MLPADGNVTCYQIVMIVYYSAMPGRGTLLFGEEKKNGSAYAWRAQLLLFRTRVNHVSRQGIWTHR